MQQQYIEGNHHPGYSKFALVQAQLEHGFHFAISTLLLSSGTSHCNRKGRKHVSKHGVLSSHLYGATLTRCACKHLGLEHVRFWLCREARSAGRFPRCPALPGYLGRRHCTSHQLLTLQHADCALSRCLGYSPSSISSSSILGAR